MSLMVANRGEIALRILRTCKRLGIRSIAAYSDADRDAPYVAFADDAVRLGPPPARSSYLDLDRVMAAARLAGAEAIHPGYGFLSERPALADACAAAGLIFIGPSAASIEAMGSKINAKALAIAAGVPTVPGYAGDEQSTERFMEEAERIGFPVMVKASAGGGGKGMRAVQDRDELRAAVQLARQEAEAGFGDATLLLEKLVLRPRHLEVQVAGDKHGTVVHLFERDCSVQRNHQKLLEEAPAPNLPEAVRTKLLTRATGLAAAMGYDNLGTVEFILGAGEDEPWFLEMNTRLQVEHPVTECVTGLDLVEWQIRIAAGQPVPLPQEAITCRGHAIEARVTAERPEADFRPDLGFVRVLREPRFVRVDSGIAEGSVVSPYYDSMLAKVIASGPDRATARASLQHALRQYALLGPATNTGFLADAVDHPIFRDGLATTDFIGSAFPEGWRPPVRPALVLAAAAALRAGAGRELASGSPWQTLVGYRNLRPAGALARVRLQRPEGGSAIEVAALEADRWHVAADGNSDVIGLRITDDGIEVEAEGRLHFGFASIVDDEVQIILDGQRYDLTIEPWRPVSSAGGGSGARAGRIVSSMPGVISEVNVAVSDAVSKGDTVAVIESMKLFNALKAELDGTVTAVEVRAGDSVVRGQHLLTITPGDNNQAEAP